MSDNTTITVRTRVAPSPTGLPHVGTAFQALFDWVFAHKYKGQFILRSEDTDQKRFVEGAEEAIVEALDWLDLAPDESPFLGGDFAPYRQSERLDLYQKYAKKLIDEGKAYYCFCSPERLQEMRKDQQKRKQPPKYDRHCLNLDKNEIEKKLSAGEKAVVRMKIPDNEEIIVNDKLRGEVKFDSNIIDDQVILKSDGFPTYHLAVVVDDHFMKISHMLRGEEWLSSAPKQVLLYEFLGWDLPTLIHSPTLRNPDKSKLSKRKGNTSIWWYREQGYLPDALLNFLAHTVWKPKDQREVFSKEEMLEEFEWDQMNVTGPIFDVKKLLWLNGLYIRQKSIEELKKDIKSWSQWVSQHGKEDDIVAGAKKLLLWIDDKDIFDKALELAHERLKTLSEVYQVLGFYFEKDLEYDLKDLLQKHSSDEIISILKDVSQKFAKITDWNHDSWEQAVRSTADEHEFKHRDLFMSLRSAITARKATPPLFEVMGVLGLEESLRRIGLAINFLGDK